MKRWERWGENTKIMNPKHIEFPQILLSFLKWNKMKKAIFWKCGVTFMQLSSFHVIFTVLNICSWHPYSYPEGLHLVCVKIVCGCAWGFITQTSRCCPSVHLPIKPTWSYKHWCAWNVNLMESASNGNSAQYEWMNTCYMFHFHPWWGARTRLSPATKPINDNSMIDSCAAIKCKAPYWQSMLSMFLDVKQRPLKLNVD